MVRGLIDLTRELEEVVVATLRSDAALLALLASDPRRVRQRHMSEEWVAPSVSVFRVADDLTETEAPTLLQFDWFGQSAGSTTALNAAHALRAATLYAIMSNYTVSLGTIGVWTRYLGTRRNEDPRSGVAHLSGDVEFHPYRTYT